MNNFSTTLLTAVLATALAPLPIHAEDQTPAQQPSTQRVYGWQLMSDQERAEYQSHMRSLKTEQERQQYRMEHHKAMQERAKEKGMTLPDQPIGPGPGNGGQGMGPGGGGMGPGGGMGGGMGGGNRY